MIAITHQRDGAHASPRREHFGDSEIETFRLNVSGIRARSLHLASADSTETVVGPNFSHDVVDVILYGLLRKMQLRSDLFISKSLPEQVDQLLLSAAQTKFRSPENWFCLRLLRCETK